MLHWKARTPARPSQPRARLGAPGKSQTVCQRRAAAPGMPLPPGLALPAHSSSPAGRPRAGSSRPARKTALPGPAARGSRESPATPPGSCHRGPPGVWPWTVQVPARRATPPPRPRARPAPSAPIGPAEPGPQPEVGALSPGPHSIPPPLPAGLRRLPPPPPQPGPDSSPATSSGRFPKLNPFLCQLRAAPPRRQLSSPNFGARRPARRPGGDGGREGPAATSRRGAAAGPADGEDVGFTPRARSADAPRHGVRARHTPPPNPGAHRDTPTSPRSATAATAGGTAAGGGAAKETCHSRRGPARPGPAPAPRRPSPRAPPPPPPPPLLQGPAKFLTCSRRRGRESERAGAAAAAAEAGERGAGQASAEKPPPKQLQAPRSRRCPPRPPSAPAARWLRARVWSRGTFCLGAGERPPPQGSPPPAFPTRASHSSSRLSPLARTPPLRRPLASQSAGGRAAAAPIGLGGGPPPRPMGEGRRCGGGAGVGGGTGGGAAWCGARPLRWAGAGRGRDARPHAREGAPAGPAHSGRLLRAPAPTRARLWVGGAAEVRIQAALRPRPWPAPG
ncbi:basic proline-rich protein-like [Bos mutus]|uniref:basic proline-rich protein-like n=1 Tax=Bos mutus TaxID=72004 RepID=UPI0038B657A0